MYHSVSRGRHRRVGDVPNLMDFQSDGDGVTPRREAEVLAQKLLFCRLKTEVHGEKARGEKMPADNQRRNKKIF